MKRAIVLEQRKQRKHTVRWFIIVIYTVTISGVVSIWSQSIIIRCHTQLFRLITEKKRNEIITWFFLSVDCQCSAALIIEKCVISFNADVTGFHWNSPPLCDRLIISMPSMTLIWQLSSISFAFLIFSLLLTAMAAWYSKWMHSQDPLSTWKLVT